MKLFSPPVFADESQTLAARKLWAVLVGLLGTVTVFYLLLCLAVPGNTARFLSYVGIFDGEFIGLLLLARTGRTRLAATLLIVLGAAMLGFSAWTSGGVRSPGMMAYLLLVGIAGILQGPLAAALTAAVCGAASLFLLTADRMGFLPAPIVRHTPTSTWLALVFIMAEFVVVQVVVDWVVRRAEERALASAAERRKTEAARRESEEKFAKVFQASPDAIVISDLETGEIIDANASYEKLFGYSRAELIGRTTVALGIFENPSERQRLVRAVGASGWVRDWEMYSRNRRGERIAIFFSGELIELGGRTRLVSVIHDITERKRVETARRESDEKFAKVFRASPDAIAISDLETGRIVEVNASYEKLFGCPRAELIGRTTLELEIYEDPGDRQRLIGAIGARGSARDWELRFRTRRDAVITTLYSGELIELGGQTHLVSIIHDITERRQAEARERQSRDEFTRKLISSQEAERRRIAGELHDSLGQNLILIKNRAQIASEAAASAPALRDQFQNLQDMAAQAIAEVRHISHDLRPHQLDQLGLSRALEALIDGAAQSSQFPIERKLDPVDDLFAPEAATHLYRVAQESLSNILKHARARRARIGLERDVRDVRLWIEDDGQGFTPGPSKSGLPIGGLGLSNIAERVRILGGRLQIDSTPGRGTRIEAVFPHAGER